MHGGHGIFLKYSRRAECENAKCLSQVLPGHFPGSPPLQAFWRMSESARVTTQQLTCLENSQRASRCVDDVFKMRRMQIWKITNISKVKYEDVNLERQWDLRALGD